MADTFSLLNEVNVSLQGSNTNIFTLRNKMIGVEKKLALWNGRLHEEDVEMFPLLDEYLIATNVNKSVFFNIIKQHLRTLSNNFNIYFSENEDSRKDNNLWINNLLLGDIKLLTLVKKKS